MAGSDEGSTHEEVALSEASDPPEGQGGDYDESVHGDDEEATERVPVEQDTAADNALEPWALEDAATMAPPMADRIPLGKPLDYTPVIQDIARFTVNLGPVPERDNKVHIMKFRWDAHGDHGQIRHLRPVLSNYLYGKLKQSMPLRKHIAALVYDRGGMLRRLVALSFSSFTDGLYVPLGGQHITSALWRLYTDQRNDKIPEDEIPDTVKLVQVEILGTETPFEVRQLASGEHQQVQSDTSDTLTNEVFRHLRKKCVWLQSNGRPVFLDDNQLWLEIQAMGLAKKPSVNKGRAKAMGDNRSKKGKSDTELEV